jgi:hypothetical protein
MGEPNRRTFLSISAAGLCALYCDGTASASLHPDASILSSGAHRELANALNLRLFLENKDAFGLAGVMTMRPAESAAGRYPAAALFLFPFKHHASTTDAPAFLPGSATASPLLKSVTMPASGLSPDEYFCHFVLKTSWQNFIGFTVGTAIGHGTDKWPWHSNVAVDNDIVGFRWTSSNLNHPWFKGSRWIPDNENGEAWRARIIDGVRRAATSAS